MKNTIFKISCFLLFTILSADVYSQLIPPARAGGDGTLNGILEECTVIGSEISACVSFMLPTEGLSYDTDNPDENGAYPVNIFGCDLHIGLTFEPTGDASYMQITSDIVAQADAAYQAYQAYVNDPYAPYVPFPEICLSFVLSNHDLCSGEEEEMDWSLELFCKGPLGEYTPIAIVAATDPDPDHNWPDIFPEPGSGPKAVNNGDRLTVESCCKEPDPITPDPTFSPLIGQINDGTTAFVRNLKDAGTASISVMDVNYQNLNMNNRIGIVSTNEISIDLSGLNQGVYFVRVAEDGMIYSNTIVKM